MLKYCVKQLILIFLTFEKSRGAPKELLLICSFNVHQVGRAQILPSLLIKYDFFHLDKFFNPVPERCRCRSTSDCERRIPRRRELRLKDRFLQIAANQSVRSYRLEYPYQPQTTTRPTLCTYPSSRSGGIFSRRMPLQITKIDGIFIICRTSHYERTSCFVKKKKCANNFSWLQLLSYFPYIDCQ